MRIILEDDYCSAECNCDICESTKSLGTEVTSDEINTIFGYFITNEVVRAAYVGVGEALIFETRGGIDFAQYLNKLIEVKRSK